MLIYKILRQDEHTSFEAAGKTYGSPADLQDGFIHFSTSQQVAGTLDKHFPEEDGLLLLAVEGDLLGEDLRWEPSRGGQLYPHLYRELRRGDVIWTRSLTIGPSGHRLPDLN